MSMGLKLLGIFIYLGFISIGSIDGRGRNRDVISYHQSRTRLQNVTTEAKPCSCTCGHHTEQNGTTISPPQDTLEKNTTCGCGCSCCNKCSKFNNAMRFTQERIKTPRLKILPPPDIQICSALQNVYDDYQEVIVQKQRLELLEQTGVPSDSGNSISTFADYVNALATYKTSWIQVELLARISGSKNTTIDGKCNGDCSNSSWSRGCMKCMPGLDLIPTCSSPGRIREVPPPLNESTCTCALLLLSPLQKLMDEMVNVDKEINNALKELDECRYREDAIHRARELSITLQELVQEMGRIVAQIQFLTQTKSGPKVLKNVQNMRAGIHSMDSLVRATGNSACTNNDMSPLEHAEALKWSVMLFYLSPTNIDIQLNLHCRAFKTTTLLFKVMLRQIVLTHEEIMALRDIFDELLHDHLVNVKQTIKDIEEWNKYRTETLEEMLKRLMEERDHLKKLIESGGNID